MYEVITLTPSSLPFPKHRILFCTFLYFFCGQEVDLMKIFGCNIFFRSSCSGHENLQETGSEICNIKLNQLSYNENLIALRWKHCDIHILYFIIFYYRIFKSMYICIWTLVLCSQHHIYMHNHWSAVKSFLTHFSWTSLYLFHIK